MNIGLIFIIIYTIGFILTVIVIKTLVDLDKLKSLSDDQEDPYLVAMVWPFGTVILIGWALYTGTDTTLSWITKKIALTIQNFNRR